MAARIRPYPPQSALLADISWFASSMETVTSSGQPDRFAPCCRNARRSPMNPEWLKLLEHRKEKGFGLTLPFIYGAIHRHAVPPAAAAREAFHALILSMRDDAPDGYQIRIHECDSACQPIAGIVYRPQTWCVGWPSPYKPETSLLITSEYLAEGEPIESAVSVLWARCELPILEGRYALRDKVYQPFDDDDRAFIDAALRDESMA